MPRTSRFIATNAFYHIISRSLNDTHILRDNDDFTRFFMLVDTAKQKYPILIFHYVAMNTHFHLVVQAPNHEILSKNISHLKWHYTLWMRKKYGWKGPLWKERYKSLPIENENYLYACGMYIAYNPVRAGVCKDPGDYPYSSFRKYHRGINDPLIDLQESQKGDSHLSEQWDFRSNLLKNIFSHSSAIGSTLFIEKLKQPRNACPQK
ncbi:MAG: transposase [Candidatus Omnitrophota bacterium]